MNEEMRYKVAQYILGTCQTLSAVIDYFDLDIDENEFEDELLNENVEMCQGCGWWFESSDLIDDDMENPGYCKQCRESNDE